MSDLSDNSEKNHYKIKFSNMWKTTQGLVCTTLTNSEKKS